MRWPWTSVARLDDERRRTAERVEEMRGEIAWLRERNEKLTDQLQRVQRFQQGMSETPRRDRPDMEPMPKELHDYLKQIGTASLAKSIRDRCYREYARTRDWRPIVRKITEGEDEEAV